MDRVFSSYKNVDFLYVRSPFFSNQLGSLAAFPHWSSPQCYGRSEFVFSSPSPPLISPVGQLLFVVHVTYNCSPPPISFSPFIGVLSRIPYFFQTFAFYPESPCKRNVSQPTFLRSHSSPPPPVPYVNARSSANNFPLFPK